MRCAGSFRGWQRDRVIELASDSSVRGRTYAVGGDLVLSRGVRVKKEGYMYTKKHFKVCLAQRAHTTEKRRVEFASVVRRWPKGDPKAERTTKQRHCCPPIASIRSPAPTVHVSRSKTSYLPPNYQHAVSF